MSSYLKEYEKLRDEIDSKCSKLWDMHKSKMKCQSGCSSCCQAFKILPIEHEFINKSLADKNVESNQTISKGECKYLVDNKCSIYEVRPIICRTHGYPLVRLNEELEEYEVSFCHLNFKGISLDKFNAENVFFEDTYNSKLLQINNKYLESEKIKKYDQGQLVELNSTNTAG